ncbi:MAG: hypothetical protein GY703_13375 [Gammaproteobacteria bacterium]|nr:hypothetical protein [Gammaproteobacteria bacterium]
MQPMITNPAKPGLYNPQIVSDNQPWKIVRHICLLVVILLLSGCSSLTEVPEGSPFSPLEPGSVLELHRVLEIAPGTTRVFLQRGKIIEKSAINAFDTSCDIEVKDLLAEVQVIEKDTFTVVREEFGQEAVVEWSGVKLALMGNWLGGGYSIHRYRRIWLHSEQQPQVMRLTCRGAWEEVVRATPPTLPEIKITLGKVLSIDPGL